MKIFLCIDTVENFNYSVFWSLSHKTKAIWMRLCINYVWFIHHPLHMIMIWWIIWLILITDKILFWHAHSTLSVLAFNGCNQAETVCFWLIYWFPMYVQIAYMVMLLLYLLSLSSLERNQGGKWLHISGPLEIDIMINGIKLALWQPIHWVTGV